MDDSTEEFPEYTLIPPLEMSTDQWQTVEALAYSVQDELDCDYSVALIVAYFRWHGLVDTEKLKH